MKLFSIAKLSSCALTTLQVAEIHIFTERALTVLNKSCFAFLTARLHILHEFGIAQRAVLRNCEDEQFLYLHYNFREKGQLLRNFKQNRIRTANSIEQTRLISSSKFKRLLLLIGTALLCYFGDCSINIKKPCHPNFLEIFHADSLTSISFACNFMANANMK